MYCLDTLKWDLAIMAPGNPTLLAFPGIEHLTVLLGWSLGIAHLSQADAHPDIFTGLRSQGQHCSYSSALLWEACCCKSAVQQVSAWATVPKASQMTQMEATKLHSSYTCAVVCAAPRCTCSAAEGCCVGRQVLPSKLSLSQGSDFLDLGCMGQAPTPLQYLGSFSSR